MEVFGFIDFIVGTFLFLFSLFLFSLCLLGGGAFTFG